MLGIVEVASRSGTKEVRDGRERGGCGGLRE